MPSEYICSYCNGSEFGKYWWKQNKRIITLLDVNTDSQDIYYAVARHNYDKHGIKGGTPDKAGEEFLKIALSDKYKNVDKGNVYEE